MKELIDPIYDFMNENIKPGSVYDEVKGIDLYKKYEEWAIENKKILCTNTRFGIEFSKHFKKIKRSDGVYYNRCILKNSGKKYLLKECYYDYLFNNCSGNYEEMKKIINYIDERITTEMKERIAAGEFSTATRPFMTDEEASDMLLKEQEELENKGD